MRDINIQDVFREKQTYIRYIWDENVLWKDLPAMIKDQISAARNECFCLIEEQVKGSITFHLGNHYNDSDNRWNPESDECINEFYALFATNFLKYNPDVSKPITFFKPYILASISSVRAKRFGLTIHQYRTCLKLIKAESELANANMDITRHNVLNHSDMTKNDYEQAVRIKNIIYSSEMKDEQSGNANAVEETIILYERYRAVMDVLKSLDTLTHDVVMERIDDKKYEEIAKCHQISVSTVHSKIKHAKMRIQRKLEEFE